MVLKFFYINNQLAQQVKLDEVNAYLWQKRVDLNLKYTLDDIWNILNTHPAYRHLKE